MIGRVFDDRYEIIRKIGTGGMAEVFLAHDRHLDRDVALKVLHSKYAADDQFIERFRREASNAASLNHPNIVQIYDRGEAEGTYYIAMEYLEGRDLKEVIREFAPLRPALVTSITMNILDALRFAHRKEVIHRDIKPQNIIVDDNGRVKVTDFGIARAGSASTMTEAGSILGTAQYLSPEQARGAPVEAASDLYSLGVVMYEMVTGRLPFTGDHPVTIAMQHLQEPVVPPSQLVTGVPVGLERVIMRALAKQPEDRYLTAQSFLDDLRRVERGDAVLEPLGEPEETTRIMPMAAATEPMMALATEPTQVQRPAAAGSSAAAADEADGRRRRTIWPWLLVAAVVLILAGTAYALTGFGFGGGDRVDVPSLLGKTRAAAEQEVSEMGLKLQYVGEESSTKYPPGQISWQSPAPGDRIERNGTIQVKTSLGGKIINVPNVVGKERDEAVDILEKANLNPKVIEAPSTEADKGVVFQQFPDKGEIRELADVTIWVSTGAGEPTMVVVPGVVGQTQQAATATLQAAKFGVAVNEVASDKPKGEVVAQNPAAGGKAAEGSKVTINVSKGPESTKVDVPGVIGLTQAEAVSRITQAGLQADVWQQQTSSHTPNRVFQQTPPEGTSVDRGSVVDIVVAIAPSTTTTSTTTTVPPSSSTTSTTAPGG